MEEGIERIVKGCDCMKIEYGKERIYLIPENEKDKEQLEAAVPEASKAFCFYTMDAGAEGNETGLVITHG